MLAKVEDLEEALANARKPKVNKELASDAAKHEKMLEDGGADALSPTGLQRIQDDIQAIIVRKEEILNKRLTKGNIGNDTTKLLEKQIR